MRRTSAWPLALVFVALIVYASLYPFMGWRDQGLSPWFVFVESRTPRGTLFDWGVNVVGYMPLGFLLCLGWLRTWSTGWGLLWATLIGGVLSALMETLQIYLPIRVPSVLDIGLNLAGTALGALLAWGLERLGALTRWSQFRAHWFVPEASGALVLLALWPVALLFPTPVPLGLGQALEPLTAWAHNLQLRLELVDSSPVVPAVLPSLSANGVGLGVVLGVLMPCLLVYAVSPQPLRRSVLALLAWGLGLGMTGVSTVFSYGPLHAWGWLTAPVQIGLGVGLLLALAAVRLSMQICVALLLLVLGLQLSLLNSVSPGPYLDQTLQTWEQGRLIHFYGLAQWLGWLWPCAALVYGGLRLMSLWAKPKIAP